MVGLSCELVPSVQTHSISVADKMMPRDVADLGEDGRGRITGATAAGTPTMNNVLTRILASSDAAIRHLTLPQLPRSLRPRYLRVAVLGFFFLLRRSEYLECNGVIASYVITKSDVTFEDDNGRVTTTKKTIDAVVIRFRGGKSDQFGQGSVCRLRRSGHVTLCPIKAAWSLWNRDLAPDTLLCTLPSGKCLSAHSMISAIKGGTRSIGLDPSKFGTDSLRSGGATAMF